MRILSMKDDEPQSQNPPPTGASGGERFSTKNRRIFIAQQLRARGILSLARLAKKRDLEGSSSTALSSNSLQGDIDFLNELGFSIRTVETDGKSYLVDAAARHVDSREHRVDLNAEAKEWIAMAATSLVLGLPDGKEGSIEARRSLERTNPELRDLPSRSDLRRIIVEAHQNTLAENGAKRVFALLEQAWLEARMSIFCDAGTTNERFASWISEILLPTSFSRLCTLQVCSNSRTIFNVLGDPEVPAKAVILGGSQLGIDGVSESIAGGLTDAFLRSTAGILDFSMAFIGAVCIDGNLGFALSDSADEKAVKEIVMGQGRTGIRILCVDRSKFCKEPLRSGFRFAALCPEQIDLVITNAALSDDPLEERCESEACEVIEKIRNTWGIPVVEAGPQKGELKGTPAPRETKRGKAFRVRMKFHKQAQLFAKLGFGEQPAFPSRAMELWANAAADYLLSPEVAPEVVEELVARVSKLREGVFMGNMDRGDAVDSY